MAKSLMFGRVAGKVALITGEGYLMPTRRNQPAPDLGYFGEPDR